jgi:hypothetical protein
MFYCNRGISSELLEGTVQRILFETSRHTMCFEYLDSTTNELDYIAIEETLIEKDFIWQSLDDNKKTTTLGKLH